MKHTKKLFSLALALIMALALAVPAFAAQTAKLTINGTVEGKQYDLYRVFDLTQDEAGDNYSYTVNADFAAYFTEKNIADPLKHIGDMGANSADLSNLAKDLLGWAIENKVPTAIETVTGAAGTTVVEGLPYGYYLLNPLGGSIAQEGYATMFALNTLSGSNMEITVKAEYPTMDKTVNGEKGNNEVSIGDTLNFKLASKVPDMTGYNRYIFVMKDTLSKGLTYTDITAVKVGDKTLTAGTDYTVTAVVNEDGTTSLKIVFINFLEKYSAMVGEAVTVEYTAILNENAVIGGDGNLNDATLVYSNDPKVEYEGDEDGDKNPTGETPKSETKTFTTALTITKVDGNGDTLTGAAFRITGDGVNMVVTTGDIYTVDENGTFWKLKDGTYTPTDPNTEGMNKDLYEDIDTTYTKGTNTTIDTGAAADVYAEGFVDENGKLTFAGLGAGTYTISEIVTPNGYNTIEDFDITITFDPATGAFTTTYEGVTVTDNTLHMDIVNLSGTQLPSTGGIGTTIFYVLGGLLAVGAAVFLITKKRMNSSEA